VITNHVTEDGTVSIEPFALTIRYHANGGHGDPFEFVATMTKHGDEATLFAAHGTLTLKVRRAIAVALKAVGVRRVRYQRLNPDRFFISER